MAYNQSIKIAREKSGRGCGKHRGAPHFNRTYVRFSNFSMFLKDRFWPLAASTII